MQKRLADCQRVIGYHFADEALLEVALTHSSVRSAERECNERQEFLGDSVLGLAMTEELYKRLPDQQEGELTRIKSAVVSRGALYRVSMRLGLPRFVEVAKGVGRREEIPVSVTANLVEAIIGAIYLDAGFFPAREFILRHLGPELEDVFNDRVPKNYKSLVQHEAQQVFGTTPIYRTIEEEGPDHRKSFTVACIVRGTEYGRANGINKKEAEQEAARHALDALTRRGRGGRRRRDAPGSRGGGRDERDPGRAPPRPTTEEDAWREWAEAHAAPAPDGGAPGAGGSVRPEADEPWSEGAPAASPDAGSRGSDSREVFAEADASHDAPSDSAAPTASAPEGAEAGGAPPAAGGEGPDDDRGPRRRRRRGGRGRGRGRAGADAQSDAPVGAETGDDGGSPGAAGVAPEAAGSTSDSAGVAPEAAGESPAVDDAPPPPARERGRRRGGGGSAAGSTARGRLDRYKDDGHAKDDARPRDEGSAPAGEPPAPSHRPESARPEPVRPEPVRREPARPRPARPETPPAEPAQPRRSGPAFGDGVAAGAVPAPRVPEKAVTPLGGVASVQKAPKTDAPKGGGGFGAGL